MSTITAPVHDLLKADINCPEQVKALQKIKETLLTAPVLCYFDPSAKVQTDHKPLESIVKKHCIKLHHTCSECCEVTKYDLSVTYVKGKDLHIADTLPRVIPQMK